jgi:hypothetical protein
MQINDKRLKDKLEAMDKQTINVNQSNTLAFSTIVNHILQSLTQLKNRASWKYITIEFHYHWLSQTSELNKAIINSKRNYLKRIRTCVLRMISFFNHQIRGKLADKRDVEEVKEPKQIIIKKIETFKAQSKRKNSFTKQMDGLNLINVME